MCLKEIQVLSKKVFYFWKTGARGWAPYEASEILESARIDWLVDLTDCLTIWLNKSISMTNGELILAYANLGALVEGWLKLFYCIYYFDYIKNPIMNNKLVIEPNDLTFEKLKQFSRGILWHTHDSYDQWVTRIQQRRNAIHSFNDREIGTAYDYLEDINIFGAFIQLVNNRIPYPD